MNEPKASLLGGHGGYVESVVGDGGAVCECGEDGVCHAVEIGGDVTVP